MIPDSSIAVMVYEVAIVYEKRFNNSGGMS